jgi:osmoprotectant transport system permease protein
MSSLKIFSKGKFMNKMILLLILMTLSISAFAIRPVVVGSKNFSESIILGEMVSIILEKKFNVPVERKLALGGTKVAFDALSAGDIDVYPDYTGTGYVMILKMDKERDPDKVYEIVNHEFQKQFGIVWSPPIGFNNTYALAVRDDDARFKNVKKLSHLSHKVQDYKFGTPHEFMERKDGHGSFTKLYELNFQQDNLKSMDSGLTYEAINSQQLDMIMAYSTDGRLKAFNLRVIEDDKRFFPPYYASLLAKRETLEKFPAIQKVFELMENFISEEDIIEMNNQVDRHKRDPRVVANNFLIEQGIIEGAVKESSGKIGFFSFAYKKRLYLFKLLKEHLILSLGALLIAFVIAFPIGILLTRRPSMGKIVFPVVNTIQTIPSLALLGFLIPFIGIGFTPALLALFLYSLLPLIRNTYIGILGVDRSYIEASRGIGLTNWQILMKVEIPLAIPVILAGLRTATVIVIGTTTIAAMVGAGGLGDPIFRGVATVNSNLILLGAVPAALLAVLMDKLIGLLDVLLVSKGVRFEQRS